MIKIEKRTLIGSGKFLKIEQLDFVDEKNNFRHWEACSRVNSHGAVIIIPFIESTQEYILVRQFRPPTERYIIEFPAGLIDPGEDYLTTAIRELKEETGYEGEIIKSCPAGFSSPGLSSETAFLVFMKIDGDKYKNYIPPTFQEQSENIEIFKVKRDNLYNFLTQAIKNGDGVDNKLWFFAMNL